MSYFLYSWFAHIACILEQVKKSLGAKKHTEGCRCYAKAMLMRRTLVQRINSISVGHSHTGALI